MSKLVIYYSYTGHAKSLAKALADREGADLMEIKDVRRPGKLKAFTAGCLAAIKGKPWPIQPPEHDLTVYDKLVLFSPVWASNPPPAVNALLKLLPEGKTLSVTMVSTSGTSKCRERMEEIIKAKAGMLEDFADIQA